MIGKTILHYKIIEKLGEGGMGVVYKAEDTKLKRTVAIKFLPLQIAASETERERFKTEAQAAAALSHPNISTIYAIEEVDDSQGGREMFIVMEYIEGKELREIIKSEIPNPKSAIEYATQIAEGLQAAHAKGIVHRDIKSSNIMVTEDGKVKIMDFGLAKIGAGAQLTKEHSTLGTAAYMSPEQARGEKVDHRTDIWSFGVVLYEMLTGELPFKGEYEQAIIYNILNEEPTPVSESNSEVSDSLQKVVDKSLQKDSRTRYATFSEVLADLKSSQSGASPKTKEASEKSIVILPFKNISPDPDNEYFSDGLTEEIISDLSNVEAIRVISRTSAMQLKGTDRSIKTIGKDLNVQFLLEGSVRKAGNNLRITAQLIDISKESPLWSEKYKGTLDDIFDIQEKVSRSIVDALRLKLSPTEKDKMEAHAIDDPRAYDFYFQARQEILKMTAPGLKKALELIEHSRNIVGENVLLLSAEGYVHWQYFNSGVESDETHLDETERCAAKIFQMEPESIHGYRLTGLAQLHRKNTKEGLRNLKKVLAFDQNDTDALLWLTAIPALTGATTEARTYGERLVKIDPLTAYTHCIVSMAPYYEGYFAEAEAAAKKAIELDPENPVWKAWYLMVISTIWDKKQVLAFYETAFKAHEKSFFTNLARFFSCALKGDSESAKEVLTGEFVTAARNDFQYSVFVADGLALLNQKKEAINWLENALTRGFTNYPFLLEYDPFLRNLDGEKEFQQLLVNAKQEWELVMAG